MADVLYAGIRRYPPKAFGGANSIYKRNLGNIRHPATKRIGNVVIYGGLRKNIFEIERKLKIF